MSCMTGSLLSKHLLRQKPLQCISARYGSCSSKKVACELEEEAFTSLLLRSMRTLLA